MGSEGSNNSSISRRDLLPFVNRKPLPEHTVDNADPAISLPDSLPESEVTTLTTRLKDIIQTTHHRRAVLGGAAIVGGGIVAERFMQKKTQHIEKENSADVIEFNKEVIDGVVTYGTEKAYTRDETFALFEQLNNEEAEMNPNTYYATIFATKDVYDEFKKQNNDEFQTYLRINEEVFNILLESWNSPAKLKIRRLIITDNTMKGEDSIDEYLRGVQLNDSDGAWTFDGYMGEQGRCIANFCTDDKKIMADDGFLHEMGHAIFKLTDQYTLPMKDMTLPFDTVQKIILPDSFDAMPESWQQYDASERNDLGHTLMDDNKLNIGEYVALQLQRRALAGEVHNKILNNNEIFAFRPDIPKVTNLQLGGDLASAQVEVFRSRAAGRYSLQRQKDSQGNNVVSKTLEKIRSLSVSSDGVLSLEGDGLFRGNGAGCIDAENAVLLLKITGTDGNDYYRWMDIRDFNMAYWSGNEKEATMYLKIASQDSDQDGFDWTIRYEKPDDADWVTIDEASKEIGPKKVIDGIETYGAEQGLTAVGLQELYKNLNEEHAEMKDNTYYTSVFMKESIYNDFQKYNDESPQKLMARYLTYLNTKLRDMEVNGHPNAAQLALRRLIIVSDKMKVDPFDRNELIKGLNDSDGSWFIDDDKLKESNRYDPQTDINNSVLLDLVMPTLHLPADGYLFVHNSDELPSELFSLPDAWKNTMTLKKYQDVLSGIETRDGKSVQGMYNYFLLQHRLEAGAVHDKPAGDLSDHYEFDVPDVVDISFGESFDSAAVQVYTSEEVGGDEQHKKFIKGKFFITNDRGELAVSPRDLFPHAEGSEIKANNGVVLLRIITKDGGKYLRWFDVREFDLAKWMTNKKGVKMAVKPASEQDDPDTYDSTIVYS